MRALVVYESMYGNTHVVADHVADGMRPAMEVTVVPVGGATEVLVAEADVVVVGGPTHVHGMTREGTRKTAIEAAAKDDSELVVDPDAYGPGLRDWFEGLHEEHAGLAAAFDTRIDMAAALTGRASRGIAKRLHRHGFELVADPESFLVDKQSVLIEGEADRATAWGAQLAAEVVDSLQGSTS